MRAFLPFIFLLLILSSASTHAGSSDLLTASTGQHMWIIRPSPVDANRFDVLYHSLEMRGPHAAATVQLSARPEAVAALGDRVWIVGASDSRWRSVYSLRIRKQPELAMYYTEPENRFAVLDPLPGEGELLGFTATTTGLAALMRFNESTLRLYELRADRWTASHLPEDLAGDSAALAVDGPNLARPNLLVADPNDPAQTFLHRREAGVWSEPFVIPLDLTLVRSLMSTRGRLAAAFHQTPEDHGATDVTSSIAVAYLRPGHVLPLTHFAPPSDRWAVAGMDDGFRLIAQHPEDDRILTMQTIHWLTGEVGAAENITRPGMPTGRLWHIVLMLTITVIAVLLVLLVRPGTALAAGVEGKNDAKAGGEAAVLPQGVVVLPAMSRIIALMLDLVPGGILAVLILRVPPIELLRLPIVTHSLEQAAPYLVMIGIMFIHVTLSEMAKATSLGKALMGGRVISQDGSKPRPGQILVRNALKMLILMVPPLAIFALISRYLQGFNDILARTLVVADAVSDDEASERPEDE